MQTGTRPVPVIPFDPVNVSKVVLVITNSGGNFVCNQGTDFSCEGVALDDQLSGQFMFTATAA